MDFREIKMKYMIVKGPRTAKLIEHFEDAKDFVSEKPNKGCFSLEKNQIIYWSREWMQL